MARMKICPPSRIGIGIRFRIAMLMLMKPIRWRRYLKPVRAAAPLWAAMSIGPASAPLAEIWRVKILPIMRKVSATICTLYWRLSTTAWPGM